MITCIPDTLVHTSPDNYSCVYTNLKLRAEQAADKAFCWLSVHESLCLHFVCRYQVRCIAQTHIPQVWL